MNHDETMHVLKSITAAFDEHDLDRILIHFADDAIFESPRGPDPWGQRHVGKAAIRGAFAGRFSGIPDVRYQNDEHFVDADRGASEWTLSGTSAAGQRIEIRGCDLWTLRGGKVMKKDSFWKMRTAD